MVARNAPVGFKAMKVVSSRGSYSEYENPHKIKVQNIVFSVNLSKARSKTKTIGKCIYCDKEDALSRARNLARLGGGMVLRDASCVNCQKIIHAFETACMRGMLLPYRLAVGLVKHPDEMPGLSRLVGPGDAPLDLPFEATPRNLLLPRSNDRAMLLEGDRQFAYDRVAVQAVGRPWSFMGLL